MKPIANLILAVVLFAFAAGCKKDSTKSNNGSIVGSWTLAYQGSNTVYTYNFKSDGTFDFSSTVSGSPTKYFYTQTGNYTVTGSELAFSNVTGYGVKDNSSIPVPKEELVSRGASLASTYTFGFNAKKDSLSLIIHCPPNASCIGLQWYKRQ